MLEEEFKYFRENLTALFKLYPNKYVVIKGKAIIHAENTFDGALTWAAANHEVGTFLVQHCTKDESGFTQTFHSRAIFA